MPQGVHCFIVYFGNLGRFAGAVFETSLFQFALTPRGRSLPSRLFLFLSDTSSELVVCFVALVNSVLACHQNPNFKNALRLELSHALFQIQFFPLGIGEAFSVLVACLTASLLRRWG